MKDQNNKFNVIFEKLEESCAQEPHYVLLDKNTDLYIDPLEFDEINELRKLSAEVAQPSQSFFTRT